MRCFYLRIAELDKYGYWSLAAKRKVLLECLDVAIAGISGTDNVVEDFVSRLGESGN